MPVPPKVVRELRGLNSGIIWYATPGSAEKAPAHVDRRVPLPPGAGGPNPSVGLVVPSWGRPCGVAEYVRALLLGLRSNGINVEVADSLSRGAGIWTARGIGVVHFQHEYALWDPAALWDQAMEARRYGMLTVVTMHSFNQVTEHNRVLMSCFARVIVHSEGMRRLLDLGGFPSAQVTVLPMGVRPVEAIPREAVRAELGLRDDEEAVGFFGFFYPQKGIVELVQAIQRLRDAGRALRCFLFASVAPNDTSRRYYDHVRAALDAGGLWAGVTLVQEYLPVERVTRYLSAMDVNVLPYSELPGKQVSAAVRTLMAALRPIVTTDTFPFGDLDGEVLKVPECSPEAIAAGIRRVLDDEALRREMVARIGTYVQEHNWNRVAARHISLYRHL